jgi:hypothetical protein
MLEMWDLWIDSVGATGLSFARSRVESEVAGDRLLVHAAPQQMSVAVRSADDGSLLAEGRTLQRSEPGPMSYLVRDGSQIRLEEGWPTDADLGRLVLLPGGEAGTLTAWWHADDRRSWRWSVEFFNHL